jgi:hypothetical protein
LTFHRSRWERPSGQNPEKSTSRSSTYALQITVPHPMASFKRIVYATVALRDPREHYKIVWGENRTAQLLITCRQHVASLPFPTEGYSGHGRRSPERPVGAWST